MQEGVKVGGSMCWQTFRNHTPRCCQSAEWIRGQELRLAFRTREEESEPTQAVIKLWKVKLHSFQRGCILYTSCTSRTQPQGGRSPDITAERRRVVPPARRKDNPWQGLGRYSWGKTPAKKAHQGTPLVARQLRLCLPPQVQVQTPVRELIAHMPCSQKSKTKQTNKKSRSNIVTNSIKTLKKNGPH